MDDHDSYSHEYLWCEFELRLTLTRVIVYFTLIYYFFLVKKGTAEKIEQLRNWWKKGTSCFRKKL